MSVITAEEFYRDALEVLIDIREIQKEIHGYGNGDPESDEAKAKESKESNITDMSSAITLESVISSIKDVDSEKTESLNNLFKTIDSMSFDDSKAKAIDSIGDSIGGLTNKINDIDVEKAGMFPKIMSGIGVGIIAFSAGISASILMIGATVLSNPVGIVALIGAIGLFGLTAKIIGDNNVNINKGSIAMGGMGLSLILFTSALAVSTALISAVGVENAMLLPLYIGGMSLVYSVIGDNLGSVLKGALAVGAVGLSLWLLASPLETLASVVEDSDTLWKIPVLLTGLGLVYAGAGAIMPLMLSGALAMGAMGASLWVVGKGLQSLSDIKDLDSEKVEQVTDSVSTLVNGIGKLSLRDMITIPLKIPIIVGMGMALIPLSIGISKFMNDTQGFDDSEVDRLGYTIEGMSRAFAVAGSTDGMSKIFGFNVGRNDVERGIDSTLKIGKNLNQLATGIITWRDAKFTEGDIEKIGNNVSGIMNVIPAIFADIGARDRGSSNQIKLPMFGNVQFGMPFTKTDTELGISSTMKIGSNLISLHKGIMSWKTGKITSADVNIIKDNIESVLSVIPAIFASIGANERGSGNQIKFSGNSIMSAFQFSLPFTKTDTELGISSTKGIGDTLSSLYKGVISWKIGGKNDITKDLDGIMANIKNVLLAIPKAFSEVGEMSQEGSSLFGLIDGNMEDGIELVTRMTAPLTQMSKVIKDFTGDLDFTKGSKNMGTALMSLARSMDHFTTKRIGALENLNNEFGDLNTNLKDHFKIIKSIPKDELMAFDGYAKSLKILADIEVENLVGGLKAHNQTVSVNHNIMPQQNMLAYKSPFQQNQPAEKSKQQPAPSNNDSEILKEILKAVSDKAVLTQILIHLKNGTIKTMSDDI